MNEKMNIRSIFYKERYIDVKNANYEEIEDGITIFLENSNELNSLFNTNIMCELEFLKILQIKDKDNQEITLINPTYYKNYDMNLNKHYIHINYKEIIYGFVNEEYSKSDEVIFYINWRYCIDKLNIRYDDNIEIQFDGKDVIIARATMVIERKELENAILCFMELLFYVYGAIPRIKFYEYKNNSKIFKYIIPLVDKYNVEDEYEKGYLFINTSIINSNMENYLKNFIRLKSKSELVFSFLLYTMKKSDMYIDIRICNMLQILDGLYDILYEREESIIYTVGTKKLLLERISLINDIDLSIEDINLINNYSNRFYKDISTDFNKFIIDKSKNILSTCNQVSYKDKLKRVFTENKEIFIQELDETTELYKRMSFKSFIEKCYVSRNRLSHVVEKQNYLSGTESIVYIHKLILLFRLMILKSIGASNEISEKMLKFEVEKIDEYILKNI